MAFTYRESRPCVNEYPLLQPVLGYDLEYLLKEHIDLLKLRYLTYQMNGFVVDYNESVHLVGEEYKVAYKYLQSWEEEEDLYRKGAGMVVTSQPGIGMYLSPVAVALANNRLVS